MLNAEQRPNSKLQHRKYKNDANRIAAIISAPDCPSEKTVTKRARLRKMSTRAKGNVGSAEQNEATSTDESSAASNSDRKIVRLTTTAQALACPGLVDNLCQCVRMQTASAAEPYKPLPAPKRPTHMHSHSHPSTPFISSKRLAELRGKALEAAKNHKTFTIRGCFYSIRRSLLQRGWVERLDIHRRLAAIGYTPPIATLVTAAMAPPTDVSMPNELSGTIPERKPGESKRLHILKCERNIMSRFLEHKPIDFLWASRKERSDLEDMKRNASMLTSRFHRKPFTSKSGMCALLRDFHWFFQEGAAELYYPRCYNVFNPDEMGDFVDNFRISACVALLQHVCGDGKTDKPAPNEPSSELLVVPLQTLRFAIDQCQFFVRCRNHDDIDDKTAVADKKTSVNATSNVHRIEHDWELLLLHHLQLTAGEARLHSQPDRLLMLAARKTLHDMSTMWPQFILDGCHNIWIVKPSNRCRGKGIRLMNDLKQIRQLVDMPTNGRWVVQKYIGEWLVRVGM